MELYASLKRGLAYVKEMLFTPKDASTCGAGAQANQQLESTIFSGEEASPPFSTPESHVLELSDLTGTFESPQSEDAPESGVFAPNKSRGATYIPVWGYGFGHSRGHSRGGL